VTAPQKLLIRRHSGHASDAPDHPFEISLRVPTALEVVEEAVDLVARHCLASGLAPRSARFNLRVALSEALSNAIVYGNRLDPHKFVDVRVVVTADSFSLHVQDEGEGFDYGDLPDPTVPEAIEATEGRGLFLIRQLMDDVQFNERGNSICMTMRRA